MPKYYFTYGSDDQPFVGGWTEIEAPNAHAACAVFRSFHPDKTPGILNCSSAYTEENFLKTCMATPDGNFHKFCHERISVHYEKCDPNVCPFVLGITQNRKEYTKNDCKCSLSR